MADMLRNTYQSSNNIQAGYQAVLDIYKNKGLSSLGTFAIQSADALGLEGSQRNSYIKQINSKYDPNSDKSVSDIVGGAVSFYNNQFSFDTPMPEGNYISGNVFGSSLADNQMPVIQDKVSIIGQDNSLEAFLAGNAAGGSALGGSSSGSSAGGGSSGGRGSYAGGGSYGGSGGGSAIGGGASILSSALGGLGASGGTSNNINPTPSIGTPANQSPTAAGLDKIESDIVKKLKLVSRTSRMDGILSNTNLRQQTLLGR